LHPANDAGFQDSLRHFSRSGDPFKIRKLYEKMKLPVPRVQAIREADIAASSSRANDHTPLHVTRVNNPVQKMMRLAKRARDRPVPDLVGTPEERNYYSHKEQYERDPVYAAQCVKNGNVAEGAEDGTLWFRGTNNDTGEANVWCDADIEHDRLIARKAAGETYNNPQQPEQSRRLNPPSAKRKHSSSGGSWTKNEWWGQPSWKEDW